MAELYDSAKLTPRVRDPEYVKPLRPAKKSVQSAEPEESEALVKPDKLSVGVSRPQEERDEDLSSAEMAALVQQLKEMPDVRDLEDVYERVDSGDYPDDALSTIVDNMLAEGDLP